MSARMPTRQLKCAPQDAGLESGMQAKWPALPCNQMQILVVEDERRMADLLRRTLKEEGHQVILARDGREGLEIARCSEFDVIVLDATLPVMDGLAVARKLRENRNQTPVLMLTARDAPADIVTGLDAGADDYL